MTDMPMTDMRKAGAGLARIVPFAWVVAAVAAVAAVATVSVSAQARNIPAPKLELIRQATAAMKLDQRIHGLVRQQVDARTEAFRIDNPGVSDSLVRVARALIADVYTNHLEGRDGLMPRVYAVLDRHLTEEDLRFAVHFSGSDQGRRYRELVPRVVAESLDAGRTWSQSLEPEIRRRLYAALRGTGLPP